VDGFFNTTFPPRSPAPVGSHLFQTENELAHCLKERSTDKIGNTQTVLCISKN
jgi:hypothetical protein